MLLVLQLPMTDGKKRHEEKKARGDKVLIRGSRVAVKYLLFYNIPGRWLFVLNHKRVYGRKR